METFLVLSICLGEENVLRWGTKMRALLNHIRAKYWPERREGVRVKIAAERALSTFCVLAGLTGAIVTIINLQYIPEYGFQVGLSGVVSVLCLVAPLIIIGASNFKTRARYIGFPILVSLALLSIANGQLINPSNILLIPCIMTFTLVLGWRCGGIATALTLTAFFVTHTNSSAQLGENLTSIDFEVIFAGFVLSAVFIYLGAAIFRSEMIAAVNALGREKDKANAANKAKDQFLATMSHEIRTPLNGILGLTETMNSEYLSPENARKLELIEKSGSALAGLIENILDFSKIETGKLVLNSKSNQVLSMAQSSIELWQELASEKSLQLEFKASDDLPKTLVFDDMKVRQCLTNLVSNALKFTAKGKISIGLWAEEESDGHYRVYFSVADTGIGISEDAKTRIFSEFEQADNSTTRKFGGSGLGLAISKKLATLMGGDISVQSEDGKGSIFTFSFMAKKTAQAESRAFEEDSLFGALSLAGRSVLNVDDQLTNRLVLRYCLDGTGCDVQDAAGGAEALELLARQNFDLVLLDARMPQIDGASVLSSMRSSDSLKNIPVIMVTADVTEETRQTFYALGADGFASKPVSKEILLSDIAMIMKQFEKANGPANKQWDQKRIA